MSDDFDWDHYIETAVEGTAKAAAASDNEPYQFSEEEKAEAVRFVKMLVPRKSVPLARLIVSTVHSMIRVNMQSHEDSLEFTEIAAGDALEFTKTIREGPLAELIAKLMISDAEEAEISKEDMLELARLVAADSDAPKELRDFMMELTIELSGQIAAEDEDISSLSEKIETQLEDYSSHELFQRVERVLGDEDHS